MYSPKYAIETDREKIDQVVQQNPFATLVYQKDGQCDSFHLPLIKVGEKLIGHLARANPAGKDLDKSSVLVIFHGPHGYISPEWYGDKQNVPTWNYISIQVRGLVKIVEEESFLRQALVSLAHAYDPEFPIEKNIDEHPKLLPMIVGIEISIQNVFAKFKLAQSKAMDERRNVIQHLKRRGELPLALAMEQSLI